VLRGDRQRLLGFTPGERPLALQLGGSEPESLAEAARIGADWGYDEINLNVGCPSDRVQEGRFGACLMREPETVAAAVAAMRAAVDVPITVKCRIGVDDQEPRAALFTLARSVADAGVGRLYVHARKAWLEGLSPKENRDVPPLDYDIVRALKAEHPHLEIVLNGGLKDLLAAEREGRGLDGVMLGRAAYQDPWLLAAVDPAVYGATAPVSTREQAVEGLKALVALAVALGRRPHAVTRHALGLFHRAPGARAWRRVLSEEANRPEAGADVVDQALAAVREAVVAV
jgi:tRNA-dihydrouridine synthase A